MARWFRSEPMEYISLIVNEDAAHDCLADLGKLGVIQFSDVSSGLLKSLRNLCKRVGASAASRMPELHSSDGRQVVGKFCLVMSCQRLTSLGHRRGEGSTATSDQRRQRLGVARG